MEIASYIVLISLAIFTVIGFFGVYVNDDYKKREKFSVLWLFSSGFLILYSFIITNERIELLKERGKCPEYEKIENVYKLKE